MRSARFGSSPQPPFVILSVAKNHSPQHNADRRAFEPTKERQCVARVSPSPLFPSLEPHVLRTTHHTVERGIPARGGYPLHSPLSYYSTHSSPSTHSILYSEGLPTHDPISCLDYCVLGTRYLVLAEQERRRWRGTMAASPYMRACAPKGVPLRYCVLSLMSVPSPCPNWFSWVQQH
jgi:hypothetical protein